MVTKYELAMAIQKRGSALHGGGKVDDYMKTARNVIKSVDDIVGLIQVLLMIVKELKSDLASTKKTEEPEEAPKETQITKSRPEIQSKEQAEQARKARYEQYLQQQQSKQQGSGMKPLNPWMAHVAKVRSENPSVAYKDILALAKKSYVKGSGQRISRGRDEAFDKNIDKYFDEAGERENVRDEVMEINPLVKYWTDDTLDKYIKANAYTQQGKKIPPNLAKSYDKSKIDDEAKGLGEEEGWSKALVDQYKKWKTSTDQDKKKEELKFKQIAHKEKKDIYRDPILLNMIQEFQRKGSETLDIDTIIKALFQYEEDLKKAKRKRNEPKDVDEYLDVTEYLSIDPDPDKEYREDIRRKEKERQQKEREDMYGYGKCGGAVGFATTLAVASAAKAIAPPLERILKDSGILNFYSNVSGSIAKRFSDALSDPSRGREKNIIVNVIPKLVRQYERLENIEKAKNITKKRQQQIDFKKLEIASKIKQKMSQVQGIREIRGLFDEKSSYIEKR